MAYATLQEHRDAYAGADANSVRLTAVMHSAAGMVSGIAPPGADPAPGGYSDLAKSAEILAGEYLFETGGYLSTSQVGDFLDKYGSRADVESAIASIMGSYAETEAAGDSFSFEVQSTFPPSGASA